jgi:hypothetical protein
MEERRMKITRIFMLRSVFLAVVLAGFAATVTFGQETYSVTIGDVKTLTGQIKWKKTLGTIPSAPGKKDAHPNPCSPFFVAVTVANKDQSGVDWFDDKLQWVAREGEYNICKYEMKVFPNVQLLVRPGLGSMDYLPRRDRTSYLVKQAWVGGEMSREVWTGALIGPTPGAGYDRNFAPRSRLVTLGTKDMYLSFEMTYSQIMEGRVLR